MSEQTQWVVSDTQVPETCQVRFKRDATAPWWRDKELECRVPILPPTPDEVVVLDGGLEMNVIQKAWGTQIWLNDSELIMVMRAGTKTSMHYHTCHDTSLTMLSGSIAIEDGIVADLHKGQSSSLFARMPHRIVALTDCIIHEKYVYASCLPLLDIVRLPDADADNANRG